ncbi:ABC transporter, partial [Acinetobacter baumannii]
RPDGGTALVNGFNVHTHPLEVKRRTGYLPEANPLYYDMYVKEYLAFIGGVHRLKPLRQAVEMAIALTGLGPESGKKISQLSKGYKQRVG